MQNITKQQLRGILIAAAAILIAGCLIVVGLLANRPAAPESAPTPVDPNTPLISTAQGLGEAKVPENLWSGSRFFEKPYDSTNGAINFDKLDSMEWTVERVLTSPEGKKLPGDNFKAYAQSNFSFNTVMKEWVQELKDDGWTASNEVKAEPQKDEAKYEGTDDDYRYKPYSVDLIKGKTNIHIDIAGGFNMKGITLTLQSQ